MIKYFLCESAVSLFFVLVWILLIGMGGVNWIRLYLSHNNLRAVVNTAMNIWFP
jgi:hypothetical protein